MAKLQQPQILLHNSGQDGKLFFFFVYIHVHIFILVIFGLFKIKIGTLRSAAAACGIKAITVEIGNPQTFEDRYVQVEYWNFRE
jgi:hypothetical protein